MKRNCFSVALLACFLAFGMSPSSAFIFADQSAVTSTARPEKEKPNVLLLLVDDLKPALGCYGDKHAKTPGLDALAAKGMRFDLAYCNQAVCAPSRFTLMLGSHSTATGLYGLGSDLRKMLPNAVTMPQHFAKHGYRTESLGKVFHIGHGNLGDPKSFSVEHSYDKVIEYLEPESTDGGQLTREEAMFTNQKLGNIRSLPRGAAFEDPDVDDNAYADGRVAEETIKRLRAAKARRDKDGTPFFITAGFVRPHLPFSAPKKYWDMHDPKNLPFPEFEDHPAGSPNAAHKRDGEICNYKPVPRPTDSMTEGLKRELIHGYYASTSFVDAQISKVVSELDELGMSDNTIVVLWGDHGFHLGDLGVWTKHTNYEQANRIPILIVAPGVTESGSSTNQPAESVDIYPTLAELAGLPAPAGPQPMSGKSLVPVLKDPNVRVRDHAYHAYPKKKLGRAIRTERYRLVEWKPMQNPEAPPEYELYDYASDPLERANLASKHPEIVEMLKEKLAKYPAAVGRDGKPVNRKTSVSEEQAKVETPMIKNSVITISTEVRGKNPQGVVIAQGGNQQGYSLHFVDGKPTFDVRINGDLKRIMAREAVSGKAKLVAKLDSEKMTIIVNGISRSCISPGLIPSQPKDDLNIGFDADSAAGKYFGRNPFNGKILQHNVVVESVASQNN